MDHFPTQIIYQYEAIAKTCVPRMDNDESRPTFKYGGFCRFGNFSLCQIKFILDNKGSPLCVNSVVFNDFANFMKILTDHKALNTMDIKCDDQKRNSESRFFGKQMKNWNKCLSKLPT